MKAPKTLDNKLNNTVAKELEECIVSGCDMYIITGFFSMHAYYQLKSVFDKVNNVFFIFTKPRFLEEDTVATAREYEILKVENNDNDFFGNDYELHLKNEMNQAYVGKKCAEWIDKHAQVKCFKQPNQAEPRMIYIDSFDDDTVSITGSVDFTTDALGLTSSNRSDLNTCYYGFDFTKPQKEIFDRCWNETNVVDVKDKFLEKISQIYIENTPQFIYYLTLYYLFKDTLTDEKTMKSGTGILDSKIWNTLYNFQSDAAIGLIGKLEKFNGAILADSVGLGKTYTALAVIKYYELRNDRVLVLTPKRLKDNWSVFIQNSKLNPFLEDRFNFDVLNHSDLNRKTGKSGDMDLANINWGNYDLVVIDESHNFRNNPAHKDHKTRYQYLMDDVIKSGTKTKVLMLSATPVNNKLNDIKNQINLIVEGDDLALRPYNINSISNTLKNAQTTYNKWSKLDDGHRTEKTFLNQMEMDYFKLLDLLTIARSRKHIEKYYDIKQLGNFPKHLKPINKYPILDTKDEFPHIEKINDIILSLSLAIFNPYAYILPEKEGLYSQKYDKAEGKAKTLKQKDRSQSVVYLMRTNLLKRLESSIHSFKLTLKRLDVKINKTLEKIDKQSETITEEDIDIIDIDSSDEEEYDDILIGDKTKILLKDMEMLEWKRDLEYDKKVIGDLLDKIKPIDSSRDNKLKELKEIIFDKINNPINPNNKKIIVFSAFADTVEYLYDSLKHELKESGMKIASITGSSSCKTLDGNTNDMNRILCQFSPKSKNYTIENENEELDLIIATDCISEGQNLQDCDYLINYDIHWNPIRIIQRFGRIDRIGSTNKQIQLVNFWPTKELDNYINLQSRVKNRMVLANVSSTGENNLLKPNNKEMLDLKFRKQQLMKLQEDTLNLEDMNNTISITDLTLNDFKIELNEYIDKNSKELKTTPKGVYSIIPSNGDLKEGVIFLLKSMHNNIIDPYSNPLSPYYLLHITKEGVIDLNYPQAKQILDYYKKYAGNVNKIQENEVKLFNKETKNGRNMKTYSQLLHKAIEDINGKQEEVGVKSLFSKDKTILKHNQKNIFEEFEIITFLIIK